MICRLPTLVLFIPCLLHADDTTSAGTLRALGAEVALKDGALTKLTFRDCSKLGDTEFRLIGQCVHLKSLTLYGKCHGLTDATLPHLADLKELEELGTDGIQVTDDGLKNLTALTSLKSAAFFHTSFGMKGFTGTGFGHLKALPKLERLTVAGISMGDEGLEAISQITQLREFSSWHTYQTQAGNAQIAKLPNLRSLRLGQRLRRYDGKPDALSLDDSSLATFAAMKSLESLTLFESRFTLGALRQLKALPNLKRLTLQGSDVAPADVEALRTDMPGVGIDWKPLTDEERSKLEAMLKP